MSKYVKNLISDEIKSRLEKVADAIIVDVIGMDSEKTFQIRKLFREKGINMLVVKRSLAFRATEESSLEPLFATKQGSVAVVWGCEDFVSLAKEIAAVIKSKEFEDFELKGGVMDGEALTAEKVLEISKWPNRQEQISLLVGQILGPGSQLSGQLLGAGSTLAGQIKKLVEDKEGEA
ncbi:MAG TPA: 50S ribosomal protein L10 [Planctomycetaceae bacterium]|nr:50S ribosomal protein L10 [Planctomycetaceae bacterium]